MYIDDGLLTALGYDSCKQANELVCSGLKKSGFLVNEAKSHWTPSPRIQWPGFIVDAVAQTFYVSEAKLCRLIDFVRSLQAVGARHIKWPSFVVLLYQQLGPVDEQIGGTFVH
jgi:hypothetical protein